MRKREWCTQRSRQNACISVDGREVLGKGQRCCFIRGFGKSPNYTARTRRGKAKSGQRFKNFKRNYRDRFLFDVRNGAKKRVWNGDKKLKVQQRKQTSKYYSTIEPGARTGKEVKKCSDIEKLLGSSPEEEEREGEEGGKRGVAPT